MTKPLKELNPLKNSTLKERIRQIAFDRQEAGMIEQAIERDDRPRCRICGGVMREAEENDSMVKCRRDRLVISKRLLDE